MLGSVAQEQKIGHTKCVCLRSLLSTFFPHILYMYYLFYNIKHHNGVTDHKTLTFLLNIKHHGCITNWLTAPLKILFLLIIMNLARGSCQAFWVAVRPALLKRGDIIKQSTLTYMNEFISFDLTSPMIIFYFYHNFNYHLQHIAFDFQFNQQLI